MKLRLSFFSLLLVVLFCTCCTGLVLTSCARQPFDRSPAGTGVQKPPAEGELEAIPSPVSPQKKTAPGAGEMPYVEEQEPPKVEEQGSGTGFRVQIFASSSLEKAEDVAKQARKIFSERVYVEYSAPLYRVRVGDFATREEALVLKDRAVDAGFEGAWITEASIERR